MSTKWCIPGKHAYHDGHNKNEKVCRECKEIFKMRDALESKERKCLGPCGKYFHSEHKGNRICGSCKKTAVYENSNEEYNVSAISKVPR